MRKNCNPYRPQPKLRKWTYFLCALLALSSCKKNYSSSELEDDKLVILAEITAGDSVRIPVGKTVKAGGGSIIRFEKVNNVSVILKQDTLKEWPLQLNWSVMYSSNPTTMFTSRRRLRYNTTYSVEVRHPELGVAKATTHIPPPPRMSWSDTVSTAYNGKKVLALSLSWQDAPDRDNYYIIEAVKEPVGVMRSFRYRGVKFDYDSPQGKILYEQISSQPGVKLYCDTIPTGHFTRLSIYTDDAHSENTKIDKLTNPFRRIFFAGSIFNRGRHDTKIYIDPTYFVASAGQPKGRVRIQFKWASKELYDYLFSYEKYKTSFGTVPANQLISPAGNVTHGLGIFGGSSRRERIFYFDQLK